MKTKIAHILHSVGGVDVSLRLILSNIDPNKFTSVVIHGKEDTKKLFLDKNQSPVSEYRANILRNINPLKDIFALREAYKIIKKEKPDIIHAHSAKGGIIGKWVGNRLGIPVLHTPQAYSYLSAETATKKATYIKIEQYFAKLNNRILASSNSERNRAIDEIGYTPENALLFNNSIKPIEHIGPLSIEKTWPDNYICSVGRPSFQKNIEMMIAVLKELKKEKPDIHLVLMGVGFHSPNLAEVKKLIKKYGVQGNITLLEWTEREDIFHIIKHAKLYISTARYEGLPYSVIEALALKKACVVTDADGNRDLITNKQNGFVIFDENVIDFKNKVIKLLNNKSLRTEFENNAYAKFDAHFNIENTIGSLEKIYLENSKP